MVIVIIIFINLLIFLQLILLLFIIDIYTNKIENYLS